MERPTLSAHSFGSHQTPATVQPINPPNPTALFRTVAALVEMTRTPNDRPKAVASVKPVHPTNTKTSDPTKQHADSDSRSSIAKAAGIHYHRTTNFLWQQATRADHCNEYKSVNEFGICNDNDNDDDACLINDACADATNTERAGMVVDRNRNESAEHSNNNNDLQMNETKLSGTNNNCDYMINSRSTTERRRKTPNTLDLISSNTKLVSSHSVEREIGQLSLKKRKIASTKANAIAKFSDQIQLNGIVEECEYDSDIGKFNCKTSNELIASDNSSGSIEFLTDNASTGSLDEQKLIAHPFGERKSPQANECPSQMVMKRIEFFEHANDKSDERDECDGIDGSNNKNAQDDDKMLSTILCLVTFMAAAIGLYLFPLPA